MVVTGVADSLYTSKSVELTAPSMSHMYTNSAHLQVRVVIATEHRELLVG